LDVDTSSAGFSGTPYYFTSLRGKYGHAGVTGTTSIYHQNQGFRIHLYQPGLTVAGAKDLKYHIQWLAVGV